MPDPGAEQRLAGLRRRWESERSPTASVSLAEEYRRLGRHQEARSVLETSLKAFPQHLSALVALGRVRLESGDAAGAVVVLEKVLERDPMQLVANKMLAQAYLDLGRTSDAEPRLRIYALLNDRDPELLALQRRLRQAAQPVERPLKPAAAPSGPGVSAVASAEAGSARFERAEDLLFELEPMAAVPPDLRALVAPAHRADQAERSGGEIFAGLDDAAAAAQYQGAWRLGSVFATGAVPPGDVAERADRATKRAPVPAATVMLGDLYLQQGHPTEAEGIFAEVLRAEPWNGAAQSGLRAAQAAAPATGDPRLVRLRSYLDRVRRAREHPSGPDVR